ncbi:Putative tyrosine-protein kinase YveL [Gammaproteobacteria bacterium]|nr:AAA family ATPase [Gammaproteobacteria bacterium]CAG0938051.1 Putative tyrosine-protein kinase YveL [Gammaproteobacteria bacterium]
MERIRKALEQAGRERAQNLGTEPRPGAAGGNPAQDLSTGVRYTQTRIVDVPEQVLRDNRLVAAVPGHELSDAYRMLRTRVLQTLRENHWTSVAVTGPASGCGKTLTAINLAISLAMEVTHTVLLVDLDLRKPSVHQYFNYQPELGLSDYLKGEVPVHRMLFTPSIERLVVLPGREPIQNSSEMLRSPKMVALVNEIKHRYPDRLVVFDLPPILAADDALAFAPYTDSMLMVAEAGGTSREDLQKALEVLKSAPVIGTVLNKAHAPRGGYGYARQRASLASE